MTSLSHGGDLFHIATFSKLKHPCVSVSSRLKKYEIFPLEPCGQIRPSVWAEWAVPSHQAPRSVGWWQKESQLPGSVTAEGLSSPLLGLPEHPLLVLEGKSDEGGPPALPPWPNSVLRRQLPSL